MDLGDVEVEACALAATVGAARVAIAVLGPRVKMPRSCVPSVIKKRLFRAVRAVGRKRFLQTIISILEI